MARSLGIFVTTDRHMDKIIGLAQAAKIREPQTDQARDWSFG